MRTAVYSGCDASEDDDSVAAAPAGAGAVVTNYYVGTESESGYPPGGSGDAAAVEARFVPVFV